MTRHRVCSTSAPDVFVLHGLAEQHRCWTVQLELPVPFCSLVDVQATSNGMAIFYKRKSALPEDSDTYYCDVALCRIDLRRRKCSWDVRRLVSPRDLHLAPWHCSTGQQQQVYWTTPGNAALPDGSRGPLTAFLVVGTPSYFWHPRDEVFYSLNEQQRQLVRQLVFCARRLPEDGPLSPAGIERLTSTLLLRLLAWVVPVPRMKHPVTITECTLQQFQ